LEVFFGPPARFCGELGRFLPYLHPAGMLGVVFRPWDPGPPNLQELTWFHGPGTLWGLPGAPIGFFVGPGSFLAGSLLFSFLSERFSCGSGPPGLACFPSLPTPGYSVCSCWFGFGLTGFRHPTLAWRDSKGFHGIPRDCTAFRPSILAWRDSTGFHEIPPSHPGLAGMCWCVTPRAGDAPASSQAPMEKGLGKRAQRTVVS